MHSESGLFGVVSPHGKKHALRYVALILALFILVPYFALRNPLAPPPAESMGFNEMYAGASSLGINLSEKLLRLRGKKVRMVGFMAPPLKPTLAFFVLTSIPMAICPFCSSDSDWPSDIVVVKLDDPVKAIPFDRPIYVEGTLEVGSEMDAETGFVSLVRIRADRIGEEKGT